VIGWRRSDYSGETEVLPQSSHRRYRTGSASDRPMILALGTPQRGQMIPAGRLAMHPPLTNRVYALDAAGV
jgi:hypothetical protein